MSSRVLIGIATYNRAHILPRAIESALSQDCSHLRIAVIDNCSTDDTPQLARRYPMVDWTRWSVNRGYLAARQYWMSSSSAEYFVSLDDDAWFIQGDEVNMAVRVLEQHPRI